LISMPTKDPKDKKLYALMALRSLVSLPFVFAFIFILAGRTTYWQGWVFCGLTLIFVIVSVLVFSKHIDLVRERMKPGPGTRKWDKIFFTFNTLFYFVNVIVGTLDAGRFGWTKKLPFSLYISGSIVFVLSQILFYRSMWVNRFFSSMVRIQTERGHHVVQDGPYRIVRHPGYTGGLLFGPALAIMLGSLWALIPGLISSLLLLLRTRKEDEVLKRELPGYSEYASKVRFRLIPGIW
jgi:protein-S-isoprenylcysteine O-methyltransferase Ste14